MRRRILALGRDAHQPDQRQIERPDLGHESIDDVRVAWGTYAIRAIDKATGVESTDNGRFTDVQKKIGGRWLYVVDHPSSDPPAAPAKPGS